MRGKKGTKHSDPLDPPRRRANKRRGKGTYENDRVPIQGTAGRNTGQVRLRVVMNTTAKILCGRVHQTTQPGTMVYTDEANSYNALLRPHETVCHALHEWARDADGDGIREVYTNTLEGLWAAFRTFLRPFRGVHKRYLSGYVAIFEHRSNLKRISLAFIAALIR
jgi:transposase-like protein